MDLKKSLSRRLSWPALNDNQSDQLNISQTNQLTKTITSRLLTKPLTTLLTRQPTNYVRRKHSIFKSIWIFKKILISTSWRRSMYTTIHVHPSFLALCVANLVKKNAFENNSYPDPSFEENWIWLLRKFGSKLYTTCRSRSDLWEKMRILIWIFICIRSLREIRIRIWLWE